MRLSLLRGIICLKHATKSVLRLFSLIKLAINSPWTNFYSYIHFELFCEAVEKPKNSALTRGSLSSRSSNFVPEMSIVGGFIQLLILFSKASCITCCKKVFSIVFGTFILLLNSSFCKCTAYRFASSFNTFKNFYSSWFLAADRQHFLSAFSSVYGKNLLELRFCL